MKPSRKTLNHAKAPDPFVKPCESFDSARECLLNLAESLMFVRVIDVRPNAAHYMGEALEVPMGHQDKDHPKTKTVFFDKFGRFKGPFKLGPITLVQAPLGADHPTSVPSVGELLIGSAVPNTRKSHLQQVLRGWCSGAKPLWELLRMIKQGTRYSEIKVRDLLLQLPCSITMCPKDLKEYRDQIQMLARIVLYGNVRPLQVLATIDQGVELKEKPTEIEVMAAKQLKLGSKSFDFVDLCTVKLNCPAIQEKFLEGIDLDSMPENSETTDVSMVTNLGMPGPTNPQMPRADPQATNSYMSSFSGYASGSGYATTTTTTSGQGAPAASFRPITPPAEMQTPKSPEMTQAPSSPIMGASPKPQSPKPSSPKAPGRTPSPNFALDDD